MHVKIDKYYRDTLDHYGATAQGVGWNGEAAQRIRYEMLSKIIKENNKFTICDYGCGVGYGYSFLQKEYGEKMACFTGYDYLEKMILNAREQYGTDTEERTFICGTEIKQDYDYIICSGVFNHKGQETEKYWTKYVLDTINMFDEHSIKGFAFNALTIYSDKEKMKDELYYADPMFLFDYCKRNFSRNVAVLHDYDLYDFTVLVRK